jgi:hypothetical protein
LFGRCAAHAVDLRTARSGQTLILARVRGKEKQGTGLTSFGSRADKSPLEGGALLDAALRR